MSIESILESQAWDATNPTSGTISATAASTAIVGVGTVFTTDLAAGDIILWNDGTGKTEMNQVSSVTDNLNLVLEFNASVTVAGAAFDIIKVADQQCPYFLGDNSVIRQPVVQNATPRGALGVNRVAAFLEKIDINEGINVKSIYTRLPYQYTMGDTQFTLLFTAYDNTGAGGTALTAIGENGFFHVPVENIEVPVNAYVYPPDTITTDQWMLGCQFVNAAANAGAGIAIDDFETATISQVNAPDALNAIFHPIFIGMRIIHAATAIIS